MHRELFQLREFHTPQHPSLGTNNWGGSSPLLARNIPLESLETKYLRLTGIRTRDEIFPEIGEVAQPHFLPKPPPFNSFNRGPPRPRGGILSRWFHREKKSLGGGGQKKRSAWLPGGDPRTRWPQGWC